ncbi:MAG: hypothetical protein NTX57_17290 [Armatimonadetes bacterium]|nr:hypothetical protein [Armatimonadota bacterium]
MQQQRQEIFLGKEPLPRFIQVLALVMSFVVLLGCVFLLTGKLSAVELFRPNYQGKNGFAQASVWLIGFAIICPVFLLTRRQHAFIFVGSHVSVERNGAQVWAEKCAAWRWRISGKKDIVGLELLDDAGEAYLVKLGGIPLGTKEPFDALVQALTQAGIQETDFFRKRLPFTKDIAAWVWTGLALAGAGLIIWVVWSSLHAFDGVRVPGSEADVQRYMEQPPKLRRRVVPVHHYPRDRETKGGEKGTAKL